MKQEIRELSSNLPPVFSCANCSCEKKNKCCKKYKKKGVHCGGCPKK